MKEKTSVKMNFKKNFEAKLGCVGASGAFLAGVVV